MKISILIIFALFLSFSSWAQFKFENDTTYEESKITYSYVDSLFQLQKQNDFELRVTSGFVKSSSMHFFILAFKDNKWTGRFFIKEFHPDGPLREIPAVQSKINSLWDILKANHILTIKSQEQLKTKNGEDIHLSIHDGVGYRFELVTNKSTRSFHYSSPKLYEKEFKKMPEFKWIVKIIESINLSFNLPKGMIG